MDRVPGGPAYCPADRAFPDSSRDLSARHSELGLLKVSSTWSCLPLGFPSERWDRFQQALPVQTEASRQFPSSRGCFPRRFQEGETRDWCLAKTVLGGASRLANPRSLEWFPGRPAVHQDSPGLDLLRVSSTSSCPQQEQSAARKVQCRRKLREFQVRPASEWALCRHLLQAGSDSTADRWDCLESHCPVHFASFRHPPKSREWGKPGRRGGYPQEFQHRAPDLRSHSAYSPLPD